MPQAFSPNIICNRLPGPGTSIRNRSPIVHEPPLHPEQEVQYVNNEKDNANAAIERGVGDAAVKLWIVAEGGVCSGETGACGGDGRDGDCRGGSPRAAAGGDGGDVG
jgi:hypothetical protein